MHFEEVPKEKWPFLEEDNLPVKVYKSRQFLVQIREEKGHFRICVCKLKRNSSGDRWEDGITWDELQEIKNKVGFSDKWCLECYPPSDKVINVANMRHLFVIDKAPEFGWNKKGEANE